MTSGENITRMMALKNCSSARVKLKPNMIPIHRRPANVRKRKLRHDFIRLLLTAFLTASPLFAATNDLATALQKGLFEEEANRNLDAAIAAYQSLAAQYDQDRQVAATALFRLGECYRKLGRTNEAVVQYQRILRDFSDQETLTTLSRQNLAGLGAERKASTGSLADLETRYQLLRLQLQQSGGNGEVDPDAIARIFDDVRLTEALRARRETVSRQMQQVGTNQRPGEKIDGQMRAFAEASTNVNLALEILLKEKRQELRDVRAAIDQFSALESGSREAMGQSPSTSMTDDEQQEIRRVEAMVKNSPDLINAPVTLNKSFLTPLYQAATAGQLVVARFLLDHGADVNGRSFHQGKQGQTPLHGAAENARKAMVELLLSRGAPVDSRDAGNFTPLHLAASRGFKSVAEVLLKNKADVNAPNESGYTALHLAVVGSHSGMVELLLQNGADVNTRARDGETPVFRASGETLKRLLAARANVNVINADGRTPLMKATDLGSLESVRALLSAGADPNAVDKLGNTALIIAVDGHPDNIVAALLAAKANPNILSPDYAPLHIAVQRGDEPNVELLLQHGANPNLAVLKPGDPKTRWTALHLAVSAGRRASANIVAALLKRGADPTAKDSTGVSSLHYAAGTEALLRLLLMSRVDVNVPDNEGYTPLHWAASARGVTEPAELLLKNGAQVNAVNEYGWTPLHIATVRRDERMMQLLFTAGADSNIRDRLGRTALDLTTSVSYSAKSLAPGVEMPDIAINPSSGRLTLGSGDSRIAALLREHGARDDLPKLDRIEVSRSGKLQVTFSKGTNDWNRFSLFELLAVHYGLISTAASGEWNAVHGGRGDVWGDAYRFPDFEKIIIHRASPDGKSRTPIPVNVEDLVKSGDCSGDVWLQWGDMVEIPEADHPVTESWSGLSDPTIAMLLKCLSRTVGLTIKSVKTELKLQSGWTPLGESRASRIAASFMIRSVLDHSKQLRFSSDLSRVKVTRRDPATGKAREWIVDCTAPDKRDLWLRDGDVIEVPEK